MTSTYLLNEYPLIVLPSLACAVGLNEAIVLQQINFWIANPKIGKMHDGLRWVRNSLDEWHRDNFPFWSMPTLKRVMASLDEQDLIFKLSSLNDNPYDKTLWYTINKPTILRIVSKYQNDPIDSINMIPSTSDQNDPIDSIKVIPSPSDNTPYTPHTPRARPRDLIFDTLAREYFGVNLEDKTAIQFIAKRVAKIKKELLAADSTLTAYTLEKVAAFLRVSRPGLTMPQHQDSIGAAIVEYRKSYQGKDITASSLPDEAEDDYEYPSRSLLP